MLQKRLIEKQENGEFTGKSRADLAALFGGLPAGFHNVYVEDVKQNFSATRYKYYFDCVLTVILQECAKQYLLVNPNTGEQYNPRNTAELHYIMKCIYNPVILALNGKAIQMPGSTTDLNDRDFIGQYMQQIVADHSGPPYLCEFPEPRQWAELHKMGMWPPVRSN